jgi:hypothetical protein
MNDQQIAALAEGLVPFVRDCIAETVAGIDPGAAMLPPELAAEVSRAVRALHEAPAAVERSVPRVVRIERDEDGNLTPIYEAAP